jgi:hypothetical protein
VGYCRTVRAGPLIFVAGTTGTVDGSVVAPGDAYAQTRQALAEPARPELASISGPYDDSSTQVRGGDQPAAVSTARAAPTTACP